MTVTRLSGKERVRMTRYTHLPSQATLDRMQREAEIKAIRGQTFKTRCEGLQVITPLLLGIFGSGGIIFSIIAIILQFI